MTPTRRRIIYVALLLVAGVLVVIAFQGHPEPTKQNRPAAIVALSPAEDDIEIRQTTVFAELAPQFDGELTIAGHPIPKDQEERLSTGNNRIGFTPGPGKEFSALPAGHVCAVLRYWPISEGPQAAATYSWCFNLH